MIQFIPYDCDFMLLLRKTWAEPLALRLGKPDWHYKNILCDFANSAERN